MNHRDPNSNRRKVLFVIYNNKDREISYPEIYKSLKGILTEKQISDTVFDLVRGNLVKTRRDYSHKISYIKLYNSRIKVTEDLLRESKLI
jgi:hypothetical protein